MEYKTTTKTVENIRRKFTDRVKLEEMPAYVYTYPPKGAYRPFTDSRRVAESWGGVAGPINLYVHVPYCEMKCSFCSLFATVKHSAATIERYMGALLRDLDLISRFIDKDALEFHSIYLGGGTPTILSAEQVALLMERFRSRLCIHPDAEISIEAAPNSINEAKCRELRDIGFNRISLGIQSFNDDELTTMNRRYGADLGRRMVAAAIESGFPNVNIDLIYGLPWQTLDSWLRNLEITVQLRPPTITLYPLVIREQTVYEKWHRDSTDGFPNTSTRYHWYDLALEFIESKGYTQHTLVTFARKGGGCRHEANEFIGFPTIALGVGARSYAPTLHYTNDDYINRKGTREILDSYLEGIEIGKEIPVRSAVALDKEEVIRRYVIIGLLYQGVNREDYLKRFGEPIEDRFGPEFEALELEGCMENSGAAVRLTRRGKRFSSLIAELLASEKVKKLSNMYR
jgi:oxygen-independent coproporphyrinogen-3 oxidase